MDKETLKERLLSKVDKTDSCWLWKGATREGYGAIKVSGEVKGTHRISYRVFKGKIPNNLLVCHSCDKRNCINPDHLWVGSQKDNMRDASEKGKVKTNPEKISKSLTEHKRCTKKDCTSKHRAKGFCRQHYYEEFGC